MIRTMAGPETPEWREVVASPARVEKLIQDHPKLARLIKEFAAVDPTAPRYDFVRPMLELFKSKKSEEFNDLCRELIFDDGESSTFDYVKEELSSISQYLSLASVDKAHKKVPIEELLVLMPSMLSKARKDSVAGEVDILRMLKWVKEELLVHFSKSDSSRFTKQLSSHAGQPFERGGELEYLNPKEFARVLSEATEDEIPSVIQLVGGQGITPEEAINDIRETNEEAATAGSEAPELEVLSDAVTRYDNFAAASQTLHDKVDWCWVTRASDFNGYNQQCELYSIQLEDGLWGAAVDTEEEKIYEVQWQYQRRRKPSHDDYVNVTKALRGAGVSVQDAVDLQPFDKLLERALEHHNLDPALAKAFKGYLSDDLGDPADIADGLSRSDWPLDVFAVVPSLLPAYVFEHGGWRREEEANEDVAGIKATHAWLKSAYPDYDYKKWWGMLKDDGVLHEQPTARTFEELYNQAVYGETHAKEWQTLIDLGYATPASVKRYDNNAKHYVERNFPPEEVETVWREISAQKQPVWRPVQAQLEIAYWIDPQGEWHELNDDRGMGRVRHGEWAAEWLYHAGEEVAGHEDEEGNFVLDNPWNNEAVYENRLLDLGWVRVVMPDAVLARRKSMRIAMDAGRELVNPNTDLGAGYFTPPTEAYVDVDGEVYLVKRTEGEAEITWLMSS